MGFHCPGSTDDFTCAARAQSFPHLPLYSCTPTRYWTCSLRCLKRPPMDSAPTINPSSASILPLSTFVIEGSVIHMATPDATPRVTPQSSCALLPKLNQPQAPPGFLCWISKVHPCSPSQTHTAQLRGFCQVSLFLTWPLPTICLGSSCWIWPFQPKSHNVIPLKANGKLLSCPCSL